MLSLLGKALKEDCVVELLETHDANVIYAFDRLHENTPDIYWASLPTAGVLLRFNERQILSTIFCYVVAREGFDAVAREAIGIPLYETFQLAEEACQLNNAAYTASPSRSWLKVLDNTHQTHYEYSDGSLSLITLMLPELAIEA